MYQKVRNICEAANPQTLKNLQEDSEWKEDVLFCSTLATSEIYTDTGTS